MGEEHVYGRCAFTRIDPTGQVAEHTAPLVGAEPDYYFYQLWKEHAPAEGHFIAGGECMVVDQVFGSTITYPMLTRSAPEAIELCHGHMTSAEGASAMSICTSTSEATWLDHLVTHQCSVQEMPMALITSVPPPGVIDYCEYEVGTHEPPAALQMHVAPTVLSPGDALVLTAPESGWLRAVAADGRVVLSSEVPSGTSRIGTDRMVPGVYTLVLVGQSDRAVSTGRILIY